MGVGDEQRRESRSHPEPWPSPIREGLSSWGTTQQLEIGPCPPEARPCLLPADPHHGPQQAALSSCPPLLNHTCRTFTWMLCSPDALAAPAKGQWVPLWDRQRAPGPSH